jgi:hypothetical protein
VVMVNDPAEPTLNAIVAALVIAGLWETVSLKLWVAFGVTPLFAVRVRLKTPPAVGVPDNLAVPSWLSVKLTPLGRAPVSVMAAIGNPVVLIVKEPAAPIGKLALLTVVNAGACVTVSVNVCDAFGKVPFCAVNMTE